MPSPRLSSLVLPWASKVVVGAPVMPSLVASTWNVVSSSQALDVLNPSAPLEDCQFQLASRLQRWR